MIELVGMHGLDEAKVVHVLFQMRQAVGDPLTALSHLVERVLRCQKFGNATDECETLARQKRRGTILAIEPLQLRLMLEKFQLAWRPGHVQVDDTPHFGAKLRWQCSKWGGGVARKVETRGFGVAMIIRGAAVLCKRGSYEQRPQTAAQGLQEMTASLRLQQRHAHFGMRFSALFTSCSIIRPDSRI